jgi:hypothetical protein
MRVHACQRATKLLSRKVVIGGLGHLIDRVEDTRHSLFVDVVVGDVHKEDHPDRGISADRLVILTL